MNNIIVSNSGYGVAVDQTPSPLLADNDVWNNQPGIADGNYLGCVLGAGSLSVDLLFHGRGQPSQTIACRKTHPVRGLSSKVR